MRPSTSRWLGLAILLLWGASLALPVFTTCRPGYDHVGGWFLLAFGWLGVLAYVPAWLANLFMLGIGMVLVLEIRPWWWTGILCAGFTVSAWWFTDWYDDTGAVPICHYHAGYWLWFGTGLAAALIAIAMRLIRPQAIA